jgi:hypothetical protein
MNSTINLRYGDQARINNHQAKQILINTKDRKAMRPLCRFSCQCLAMRFYDGCHEAHKVRSPLSVGLIVRADLSFGKG